MFTLTVPVTHRDENATAVVAVPLYRSVSVSWFLNFMQMDKSPIAGFIFSHCSVLPLAMEEIVKDATTTIEGWDRLVVFEFDMIPPLNALQRAAEYKPEHDIVGTTYFRHEPPHEVIAYAQHPIMPKPSYMSLPAECIKEMVSKPALYEVDVVGFGFTTIQRHVFENWDYSVGPMFQPEPPLKVHDQQFCTTAKRQGFKVWLDTGIGCGHLTETTVGFLDNQQAATDPGGPLVSLASPRDWYAQ